MRVRALTLRILNQLRHDKRTLALMLVAPIFLITLVYFILADSSTAVKVGVINAPENYIQNLEKNNVTVSRFSQNEARDALEQRKVVATLNMVNGKSIIEVDGSNPTKAKTAIAAFEKAKAGNTIQRPDLRPEVNYIYGTEDLSSFDNFGATLIGFVIFFFVFLVAGISFLQERTSGTLEKLLSMPLRRWEIVVGYVLGFGLFTVLQSLIFSWYCVYVLKVMMVGSFALITLITLLAAIVALTLGILVSTAASNEFQMVQFIPIVIIPQLFFSGLFDLPPSIQLWGRAMPLYYVADALTEVMLRGSGLAVIAEDLVILLGCSLLFMVLNTLMLKKYRRI
ncbi:ABC transporter permease [Desulfitobacterium sp.]|uniref:ABC transporter permease n=1 Tax=Desulfitobacterium sp. TaxID=49981 RepID=UPI002B204904|nr:ABC transporter permease [Desulfitobacterium sp.]MEA4901649.1 ABC transporter permease [Desulfitobacterium sp.]